MLYNELGVEKGREPALMMAAPFNSSKHDRERLVKVRPHATVPRGHPSETHTVPVQLLFEGFALPGLDVAAEPVLAAYGYGAPTGVVVDIAGDSTRTHSCVPAYYAGA